MTNEQFFEALRNAEYRLLDELLIRIRTEGLETAKEVADLIEATKRRLSTTTK